MTDDGTQASEPDDYAKGGWIEGPHSDPHLFFPGERMITRDGRVFEMRLNGWELVERIGGESRGSRACEQGLATGRGPRELVDGDRIRRPTLRVYRSGLFSTRKLLLRARHPMVAGPEEPPPIDQSRRR